MSREQLIIEELDMWSQKSQQKNLSAEEYRQCEINIFELETLLKIENRKRNQKRAK